MFTLYTPSLYSLSILLSTIPLYNPFLEFIATLGTSQPHQMTNLPLMLCLHSPSLSPLYIPFLHTLFYIPFLHPFDILLSTICLNTLFYN